MITGSERELSVGGDSKPAIEVITGSVAVVEERLLAGRSPSASACEPYREIIEAGLQRGRNAMAIWQDLVTEHGFSAKYASVLRYVVKLRGVRPVEARVVIRTAPGEESQVDYGEGPMVRDATTGKYRRTRLFILTLGYSRKSVRLLTWRSSSRIWAELHERAFRRLGGATRVGVLDNLREGVLRPDAYDPTINPLYADVLKHPGATAVPCRVRDPGQSARSGSPAPQQSPAGPVPADNGLGFHDDHYREQRPETAGQTGDQPSVEGLKAGPGHGAPKDDDLLTQDKVLAEE